MYTMYVSKAQGGGQKRSLELELQTAVSLHAGAGNWTCVLCCKNSKCFNL